MNRRSFYEKHIKRVLDIVFSLLFIAIFFWLYILIYIIVKIKMGSPVIYKQPRPGIIKNGKETIFDMYKFRTMTDAKDKYGNLLPDSQRITPFGAMLRSTSLDELPEIFCILKGDMSIVGPRPQLVRDMLFMSKRQRLRHTVKPGLTGLAQISGRNAISWDDKINLDLKYIKKICLYTDLSILIKTGITVFKKEGITDGENVTSLDYGDFLLKENKITKEKYDILQKKAKKILEEHRKRKCLG